MTSGPDAAAAAATAAPAFAVRPARDADLLAVVELVESVAAEGRWIGAEAPLDREEHLAKLVASQEDEAQANLVALAGTHLVGHLWVGLRRWKVADLGVMVAADWRGRGVGGALLEAGIDRARRSGAHKVALQVWPHNTGARALYSRFGFVEEGRLRRHYRRRNGELWDALVLGLSLDDSAPGCSLPEEPEKG